VWVVGQGVVCLCGVLTDSSGDWSRKKIKPFKCIRYVEATYTIKTRDRPGKETVKRKEGREEGREGRGGSGGGREGGTHKLIFRFI